MAKMFPTSLSESTSRDPWKTGLYFALVVGAIFFGLLAAANNPLLIVLLLGLLGGMFMLAAPRANVWVILMLSMMSGFILSTIGPGSNYLAWGIALLSMLLMAFVLVRFMGRVRGTPAFVWVAVAFMFYCLIATVIQFYSVGELVAGFKRHFQMYGLLLALALFPFSDKEFNGWLKLMLVVAVFQLPFCLYERLVLVPLRGAGAEAMDVVAGTLGANMDSGSANAEMSAFLIIVTAFLMARRQEGLTSRIAVTLLSVICLIPLGMGETKFVLIMLPLAWGIVLRRNIRARPGQVLAQALAATVLLIIFGAAYVGANHATLGEVWNETLRYNIGSGGYGRYLLNRTSVLPFWWNQHGWRDLPGTLLGHGLGSAYSSLANIVTGHIGKEFLGYGLDLTSASTLLWETGLLGITAYFAILALAWRSAQRLVDTASDAKVRADALAIQASIAVLASFVFYDNALTSFLPFQCVFAAVLGYLGHLVGRQCSRPATEPHQGV